MARYNSASKIESEVWNLKMADLPRATNRALIDGLFNGNPPFTEDEAENSGLKTNVNFLEPAKVAHDARRQFSNAFLTPGNFFTVKCDYGPAHKRTEYSQIITKNINKRLKKSRPYRETLRNVFAQVVLHGVGPVVWANKEKWCPSMQAIGDVLIPSRTLLTMDNLSKFAIRRRYTAEELYTITHRPTVDKAWNMAVVDRAIEWAQKEGQRAQNQEMYQNPERVEEDFKENSGFYSSDIIPTIDCWDFYFLEESKKNYGWKRRIILDCDASGKENIIKGSNEFLYDSKERNYAGKLENIIHFQFADGSSVAPFRYHTVRSLGFLLYSVCHLQNRLRCKFNDAVFEALMQYYRIGNPNDHERVLKLALLDKGFLAEGFQFVPKDERWQVDAQLVGMAMQLNRQNIEDNSTSFTQDHDFSKDQVEKTATQVQAEVASSSALVATMLQEAYGYQEFQYDEIARRFCIANSNDPDVKEFRAQCVRDGVPIKALDFNRWEVSAERIIGGGNKQMELAQIQMVMGQYQKFSPESQRKILRDFTFAVTSDPFRTNDLVPFEEGKTNNSKTQAQLATGTLMLGLPVDIPETINHIDYVETLIHNLALVFQQIEQTTPGMATMQQVIGIQNMAGHINQVIQIIADDPEEKQRVRQYQDALGKMANLLKGYQQRLQEQQQAQGGGENGEAAAKVQSQLILAQTKAKIQEQNNAQKLQQKQISFDQKTEQSEQKHALELANQLRQTQVQEAALDLKTAGSIQREVKPKEGGENGSPQKVTKRNIKVNRVGGKIESLTVEE